MYQHRWPILMVLLLFLYGVAASLPLGAAPAGLQPQPPRPITARMDHSFPLSSSFALASEGQRVLGVAQSEGKDIIVCWDDGRISGRKPDGTVLWSQVVRPPGASGSAADGAEGPRLAVGPGLVVLGRSGELSLLDAASGNISWKIRADSDWGPVVAGPYIITGSGGMLKAYTIMSGAMAWDRVLSSRYAITRNPRLITVTSPGPQILVVVTDNAFQAVRVENGRSLWEMECPDRDVQVNEAGAFWVQDNVLTWLGWQDPGRRKTIRLPDQTTWEPLGMFDGWIYLAGRRGERDVLRAVQIYGPGRKDDSGALTWEYYLGSARGVDLGLGGMVSFPEPNQPPSLGMRIAALGIHQDRLLLVRRIHQEFGLFMVMEPSSGKVLDLQKLGPFIGAGLFEGAGQDYLVLRAPPVRKVLPEDLRSAEIAVANQLPPVQVLGFGGECKGEVVLPAASPAAMLAGGLALREQALTLEPQVLRALNNQWSGRGRAKLEEFYPLFRDAMRRDPTNPYLSVLLFLAAPDDQRTMAAADMLQYFPGQVRDQYDVFGAMNLLLACGFQDQAEAVSKVAYAMGVKDNQNPPLIFRHFLFSPVIMAYPRRGGDLPVQAGPAGGIAPAAATGSGPVMAGTSIGWFDRVLKRGRAVAPALSAVVAGSEEAWQGTVWLANRCVEQSPNYSGNYFLWSTIHQFEMGRGQLYMAEAAREIANRFYRQADISLLSPRTILWMDLEPYLAAVMGITLILISFLAARRFRDLRHHHMQEDGLDPTHFSLGQWWGNLTTGERMGLPLLALYSLFMLVVTASSRMDLFSLPIHWPTSPGHDLILVGGVIALTILVGYIPYLSFQVRLRRSTGQVPSRREAWKQYWRYMPAFYLNTRERFFIILLFLAASLVVVHLDYQAEVVRDSRHLQQVAFQGGLPSHMGWTTTADTGSGLVLGQPDIGKLAVPAGFWGGNSGGPAKDFMEGFAAIWSGHSDVAIRQMAGVVERNRTDGDAVVNLGALLALSDPAKGLLVLEGAKSEQAHNARLLFDLGMLKALNGDSDASKSIVELARSRANNDLSLYQYANPAEVMVAGVSDQRLRAACVSWDWRCRWLLGLKSFFGIPDAVNLTPPPERLDLAAVLSWFLLAWPGLVGSLILWLWMVAVVWGGLARPRAAWPFPCDECGRPACDHCVQVEKKKRLLCRHCQGSETAEKRPGAVLSLAATIGLLLTPGFWQVRQGKTLRGTAFVMIFLGFWLMLFYLHENGGILIHWILGQMAPLISGAYQVAGDPNLSKLFSGIRILFFLVLLANMGEVLFLRGKRERME